MRTPLSDRIKAIFSRDKFSFWFDYFSDEEKKLKRMDVWQLAEVINDGNVHKSNDKKRIVAEHMLNVRLAKIQTRPAYFAIFFGIAGVVGGALLTSALQPSQELSKCVCECQHGGSAQGDISLNKNSQNPPPSNLLTRQKTSMYKTQVVHAQSN